MLPSLSGRKRNFPVIRGKRVTSASNLDVISLFRRVFVRVDVRSVLVRFWRSAGRPGKLEVIQEAIADRIAHVPAPGGGDLRVKRTMPSRESCIRGPLNFLTRREGSRLVRGPRVFERANTLTLAPNSFCKVHSFFHRRISLPIIKRKKRARDRRKYGRRRKSSSFDGRRCHFRLLTGEEGEEAQKSEKQTFSSAHFGDGHQRHQRLEGTRRFFVAGDQEICRGQLQSRRGKICAFHQEVP